MTAHSGVLSDHHLYRLSGVQLTEIPLDTSIIHGQMRGIAVAPDGTLWIGGGLPGLFHLRVDGEQSRLLGFFTTSQIISTDVQFVRFDRRGWLWVGTDLGVNVFDGTHWKLLTERDGFISNDTNEGAFFSDNDGSVWIGVNGGAIHLLHSEHLFSQDPLRITLQSATLCDRNLDLTGIKDMWRWHDAPLDIEFTSLNYDRLRSIVFRYRLIGVESDVDAPSALSRDASWKLPIRGPSARSGPTTAIYYRHPERLDSSSVVANPRLLCSPGHPLVRCVRPDMALA